MTQTNHVLHTIDVHSHAYNDKLIEVLSTNVSDTRTINSQCERYSLAPEQGNTSVVECHPSKYPTLAWSMLHTRCHECRVWTVRRGNWNCLPLLLEGEHHGIFRTSINQGEGLFGMSSLMKNAMYSHWCLVSPASSSCSSSPLSSLTLWSYSSRWY